MTRIVTPYAVGGREVGISCRHRVCFTFIFTVSSREAGRAVGGKRNREGLVSRPLMHAK